MPADVGSTEPPRKLQRDLTRLAHTTSYNEVLALCRTARDTRVVKHPTDAFLPFLVAPTNSDLVIDSRDFTSGLRSYLLLPQLLRLPSAPVIVDPHVDGTPDFSYEADACRHCSRVCDRHLAHAHACSVSSHKIKDRHELVKLVRSRKIKEAGYSGVLVEPRMSSVNARRADIFYIDDLDYKHIHYYTDDCVGHPLCDSNLPAEARNPLATMLKMESAKELSYREELLRARSAQAVVAGTRVIKYLTTSMTSLGALGKGMRTCVNAAASFLKRRATAEALTSVRADGRSPQQLAATFRFQFRAMLQAAVMKGNGLLAAEVGL
jgi:hypothetical protein